MAIIHPDSNPCRSSKSRQGDRLCPKSWEPRRHRSPYAGGPPTRPVSGRRIDYLVTCPTLTRRGPDTQVYDCADEGLPPHRRGRYPRPWLRRYSDLDDLPPCPGAADAPSRLLWLRTSKVPLRDAAGNVIGVLGMHLQTDRFWRSVYPPMVERGQNQALAATSIGVDTSA